MKVTDDWDINEAYEQALSAYEGAIGIPERMQWRKAVESLVRRGAIRRDRTDIKIAEMRAQGMPDEYIKIKLRIRRMR